ncbi:MAG: coiled-coil domain-containing protein [Bacteriovoracaceae bacterium]
MDWKKTFNHGQWMIHSIFFVAIIAAVGTTVFALRLNHLQQTEEKRIVQVTSLINHLKKDQDFEKIGKYLAWAQSDKANDKMRELAGRLAETEEILEVRAGQDLSLAMRTFNRLINSTSGMSSPADALKVFNQKVENLLSMARSQNYKTITGIAEKMKERLQQLTPKNAGNSIQINYLKSDINKLNQIVDGSTLNEVEKNNLKTRFQSMDEELGLLTNLNSHSRDLKAHINQATLALHQWLIDVEKKANDLQGIRIQKHNQLILMMAGIVGFLVLSWIGLAYLFRWQKAKISDNLEAEVKNVIQKGIMSDQRFMLDHYSDKTREDIVRLLDELKIKLNLGSMLHEGLPFAGCLVDSSFKLTWFNHLFLEQFYLSEEEVRSDAFNWDFLRDFLNLEQDPVYQALVNKIAGIYPVKVKQDELTPSQPYEMYVTPITVNREDRVMIFFYPLVSVKEAINDQVNLVKDSLSRFVTLWYEEKLNNDEIKLLEKDFKNNDIIDLFENLVSVYERLNDDKKECLLLINSLEKESAERLSQIQDLQQIEEQRREIIKNEVRLANDLKDSFLVTLEKSESLIGINKSIMQQNDDLRTEAMKMQTVSNEMNKKHRETVEIIGQLDAIKGDYKKLKLELLEVKAKLISINNSLFGQLPPLDEAQQKLAMRYKDELARLDFNVTTLDKKLSQLDVYLGKLNMMNEKGSLEQIHFSFQTSQKDHELKTALADIQKIVVQEEDKIITNFKSLHHLIRKDLSCTHVMDSSSQSTPLLS